jgi:hypothetical protein
VTTAGIDKKNSRTGQKVQHPKIFQNLLHRKSSILVEKLQIIKNGVGTNG